VKIAIYDVDSKIPNLALMKLSAWHKANGDCDPFVMPYDKENIYQKRFTRWVNHKAIFNSVKWEDYNR